MFGVSEPLKPRSPRNFRPFCVHLYFPLNLLMKHFSYPVLLLTLGLLSLTDKPATTDWPEYNGGPDRNHYSPLTQLDPGNVARLQLAWEYASGGVDTLKNNTQIQCNPLIIDGVLYGVSAGSQAFALDAATGKQLWKTAFTDDTFAMNSRGLTYWTDGRQARIFFAYGSLL